MLLNWLPVRTVTEENASIDPSVHFRSGFSNKAQGPADGKRRLIRGERLVIRISNDYRPRLLVVGEGHSGTGGPVLCGDCPVRRISEYSDEISGACSSLPLFRFGGVG